MNWGKYFVLEMALILVCLTISAVALGPTPEEMTLAQEWLKKYLDPESTVFPFSFIYKGQNSADLLPSWKTTCTTQKLDEFRTQHILIYTDPQTGLEVRCLALQYHDFPTVEWTIYFRNTGSQDTPILSKIKSVDIQAERPPEGEFLHHHQAGSSMAISDYQPFATVLTPLSNQYISSLGKSCVWAWPYFNLEWPGQDLILAIGWPESWEINFTRDEGRMVRINGGIPNAYTNFKLFPGEQVRTPLIVLQFGKGDYIRSQNIWRRWMLAHNVPRTNGRLPGPLLAASNCFPFGFSGVTEENQKLFIDRYLEEEIDLDYWWIDLGWFATDGPAGTWQSDRQRFPKGLRAVSDYAHSKGSKLIVWFHPEVIVGEGTWLHERQQWLLGPQYEHQYILNLSHAPALTWLINHIDQVITNEGIDIYRHDFNTSATDPCLHNDLEDHRGITSLGYSQGFLSYYDQLRKLHPDLWIDNCSSGGARNDLETLRRSVPLWRSDHFLTPTGLQCITYGLSLWIPFYGTGISDSDPATVEYTFRSVTSPAVVLLWDVRQDLNYDLLRRLIQEWRKTTSYYLADFYPLTPYSLENHVWLAWQFDRPESGEGMVQAFRRPENQETSATFKLRGLEPQSPYELINFDVSGLTSLTGQDLMEKGLLIHIPDQPGAVVITYKKVK